MIFAIIAAIVALCVFMLCFNIIFRKKPFPDGEISRNKQLRQRGIICAKEQEIRMLKGEKSDISQKNDCSSCSLIDNCIKK